MINSFYKAFNITSPVAGIIISIALMLITGFAMTRITKRLRLLNGTLKVKSEKGFELHAEIPLRWGDVYD